jgi:anthranilate 1,2-dioxygenase small subunit
VGGTLETNVRLEKVDGMQTKIIEFLSSHAQSLDEGNYDAWMEAFREQASYRIISAENLRLGLDMPLVLAVNKNMIRDRILSLRQANVYNIHTDHHVLGLPTIKHDGDVLKVKTPLVVHQINQDGIATLYFVGRYIDELSIDADIVTIKSRNVVFDNFGVIRLLATPL